MKQECLDFNLLVISGSEDRGRYECRNVCKATVYGSIISYKVVLYEFIA